MTEELHRLLDICVRIAATVAALVGIWVGYQQFLAPYEMSNRRPFLELQAKYYVEMLETVSKLAFPADEKERQESARRFWQMYSGTSALVEDLAVGEEISAISVCIKELGTRCTQLEMEAHALRLSQLVKISLARSWGLIPQGEVSAKR
jgi:hypothetical protein